MFNMPITTVHILMKCMYVRVDAEGTVSSERPVPDGTRGLETAPGGELGCL